MRIAMIGTGYVGLVTGACLSHLGHNVTCIDIDATKIDNLNKGIMPIYEIGLKELVQKCVNAGRLKFSNDFKNGIADCKAIFICVGTPSMADGSADLSYVFSAAEMVAKNINTPVVIVDKSTVPVGTADRVADVIKKVNPTLDFDVVSNPEFLREGVAIDDFLKPDRVVVGTHNTLGHSTMTEIYKPLTNQGVELLITDTCSSEMIKYATNAFLATKITFANDLADLCEKTGGNITDVAKVFGMDSRIGNKFLNPGPGYGGSCFPKDTKALVHTSDSYGIDMDIIHTVVKVNDKRKLKMATKIQECVGDLNGKKLAILGVTFKAGTDDMREAPSLTILPKLLEMGAIISVYDPQGKEHAPSLLPNGITFTDSTQECVTDADAIVILTEWSEFGLLDFDALEKLVKTPTIVDLRNMYSVDDMGKTNFTYHSLGRQPVNT